MQEAETGDMFSLDLPLEHPRIVPFVPSGVVNTNFHAFVGKHIYKPLDRLQSNVDF
jgi:hypothetical protein